GRVKVCGDVLLRERHGSVRPVDSAAGRGVDEAFDAYAMGMFEDFQSAKTVYRKVELWVVDGILICEVSGEMVNDVGSFLESPTQILIPGHVAPEKVNLGPPRDVPLIGGQRLSRTVIHLTSKDARAF